VGAQVVAGQSREESGGAAWSRGRNHRRKKKVGKEGKKKKEKKEKEKENRKKENKEENRKGI
jgi:hypothetical protein